jgi:hypothetical protein
MLLIILVLISVSNGTKALILVPVGNYQLVPNFLAVKIGTETVMMTFFP